MKKLLLTSAGLYTESLQNRFKDFFDKDIKDVKIMYFDTASKPEKDPRYIQYELNGIYAAGVKYENLVKYEMTTELAQEEMLKYDAIWISGGNSFYLIDVIRKTEFDKKLENVLEKGVLYVGASAGSQAPTVNVDVAMDENEIGLQDMTGMKFFNIRIIPHKKPKKEPWIAECRRKIPDEIIVLTDSEAVFVEGDNYSIIS